jgi:hypothetical protein
MNKYRVIKKYLCTWWLQYTRLQVMLEVSPASLQTFIDTPNTLTPSIIPNSNYVIVASDWNFWKYFCVFFSFNHQIHRDFMITLYKIMWCQLICFLISYVVWLDERKTLQWLQRNVEGRDGDVFRLCALRWACWRDPAKFCVRQPTSAVECGRPRCKLGNKEQW